MADGPGVGRLYLLIIFGDSLLWPHTLLRLPCGLTRLEPTDVKLNNTTFLSVPSCTLESSDVECSWVVQAVCWRVDIIMPSKHVCANNLWTCHDITMSDYCSSQHKNAAEYFFGTFPKHSLLRYFSSAAQEERRHQKPLLWLCSVALFLCGPVPAACDSSASTQTHTHTSQITAVDTRRIYGLAVSQPLHVQFITFRP